MYRILIADDEAIERQGLELMITRAMPGMFEFYHAENGRVAIEKAEQKKPDIVFMDIKMPGIRGIDALKEIIRKNPHVKTVLVTAYDYFGYAKEACSMGVNDYLLKPRKKAEVLGVIEKLVKKIEMENQQRSQELQQRETVSTLLPLAESELCLIIMMDLIVESDFHDLNVLLKTRINKGYSLVISLQSNEEKQLEHEKQYIYSTIKNFIKLNSEECLVSPLIGNRITLFTNNPDNQNGHLDVKKRSIAFAEKIHHFIEREYRISTNIGIGTVRAGLEGLRCSYYEATIALSNGCKGNAIRYYSEVNRDDQQEIILNIGEQLLRELNIKEKEAKTDSLIDRAKQYMEENYSRDISMELVAEVMNLSPYYFSKIFKKMEGITFIDYLTLLRINKSKVLLHDQNLSLKEICFQVGYNDPNYFSRVFKKVTELSPSDYRYQVTKSYSS
ncbi:response regulator [Neobacillus sp. K501]